MIVIAIGVLALLAAAIITYLVIIYLGRKRDQVNTMPDEDCQACTPDDDETMFDDHDALVADSVAVIGIDTSTAIIDDLEVTEDETHISPRFEIAHAPVAIIEGGYQRHKADTGNYNARGELVGTNWGIAAPVAEQYLGKTVSTQDMKTLPKQTAYAIFRKKFWDDMQGDSFPSQELANIVYDGYVNHGRWGIKLLQRVIKVYEDGVVGPDTMTALATRNPAQVYNQYFLARVMFYWAIVRNRPSQLAFWRGWMKRIEYYLKYYTGEPYLRPDPSKRIT